MNRYFVRMDYRYKCSPVQRVRLLVDGVSGLWDLIRRYTGEYYLLISLRVEYVVE